ncbi:TetR/AcrR family transcriptional regulator [Jatrophihabitans sp. YIM 134969]
MVRRPATAAGRRQRALATARRERAATTKARDRILTTADRLFYGEGIQAVGVQRVVEEAEVTRVTFYRHFPSKDDLVLAYLDARAKRAHAAVGRILEAHAGDPRRALEVWAQAVVDDGVIDEYRGCTFVNAAAEYGDGQHPVRRAAIAQRTWVKDTTAQLLREAGHPDPDAAARTLLALRTGFVFAAGLEDPPEGARDFLAACRRVVDGA